jgi:ABC-2 type transport system permease protein
MHTASAIETGGIAGYQLNILLRSEPGGWNMKDGFDPTATELHFESSTTNEKGIFPVAISLQKQVGKKQQQIIICGDADFMSNGELGQGSHLPFTYHLFRWFTAGRFPVSLSRPLPTDDELLVSKKQLSLYKWIILWGGAGLIIAAGALLLINRKRN